SSHHGLRVRRLNPPLTQLAHFFYVYATKLMSRLGTNTTFFISFSSHFLTSSSAFGLTSSSVESEGSSRVPRTLPLTCTTNLKTSSERYFLLNFGHAEM